ncbi:predicted protein [Streptomyces viridochromogenes DSM 40736]|uniref:Predicted protein n=1 Tax=Streptomyces viridochromogenes (strain DSM 40736 / JCM 4977 / BCRC 1201 / Tue 494) TaxID=591159 RepID=D9X3S8_STRVT|nr:predicted protein [Streptomyces viridochromogenes DSM 40736]
MRTGIASPSIRPGHGGRSAPAVPFLEPAVPVRQSSPLWGAFRTKVSQVIRPRT